MDLELSGKVGIVTGASRGIGRAIAETLAAEGMRLVLVARTKELLESLAAALPTATQVEAVDLRDPDVPAKVVASTIERFGAIDLLVNVAGATKRGDFLVLTDADWDDGFALKLFGAMRLCRAAWPHLVANRGSIVNISGVGGKTGNADFTIGGSVNAALLNFTKALADRGVREGVRVNAVNPGSILTERLRMRVELLCREEEIDFASAEKRMAEKLRIARFGAPAEVARAVAFLASPNSGYCQGVILDVDGGATRTL